ncbi:glycosyltransferase family 4 protein [Winogradskyella costae]|uniref:glycosyltransferase family 4 protein n=1 Tax=Winogradskyella costae TaxID=2697008 RepID=UPI0015C787EC|nr:glycosyltransferase family 4 protein [Winogradskyella costae]
MSKTKIAIIQTHPIQHFCPQFASYSKLDNVDLDVIFETNKGLESYFDEQFNREIKWDNIDLDSFKYQFLKGNSIESVLDSLDPDIIIVYGYSQLVQKNAYNWALKFGKKIFYVSDSTSHRKQNPVIYKVKKTKFKPYFKAIDICLSVGDSNESVYRGYGVPDYKMVRTFFPIDTVIADEKYSKKAELNALIRAKYNISKDTLVISTIGKIEIFKRQEDLIALLSDLESIGIKAHAFICGSGKALEFLQQEAKKLKSNTVTFTGFVKPIELLDILCASDLYVHPSSREAHSLSITEAIYFGCPVILSDACGSYGPTDDIRPGKNGFVYPVGDIIALTTRVKQLFENPKLMSEFSKASVEIGRYTQKLAHGEALQSAINLVKGR